MLFEKGNNNPLQIFALKHLVTIAVLMIEPLILLEVDLSALEEFL